MRGRIMYSWNRMVAISVVLRVIDRDVLTAIRTFVIIDRSVAVGAAIDQRLFRFAALRFDDAVEASHERSAAIAISHDCLPLTRRSITSAISAQSLPEKNGFPSSK